MLSCNSSSSEDISSDSDIDDLVNHACETMKTKMKKLTQDLSTKNKQSIRETDSESDDDSEKDDQISHSLGFEIDKLPNRDVGHESSSDDDVQHSSSRDEKQRKLGSDKIERKNVRNKLATSLKSNLSLKDSYFNTNLQRKREKTLINRLLYDSSKDKDKEIMKKSVITPDFEKKDSIPKYEESLRQAKKQRKADREKTKGKGWFEMPATEMTEERKNDLTVLQMRRALDPKRFYKGNDIRALPKYFQFGTVVESAADFYHSRVPKKQRKSTMVDELLADAEFRRYNKRKYVEIQESKRKGAGPYKHMKRLKKKKK